MGTTISGHPAANDYDDARLATGVVPGTDGIKLTVFRGCLPLFLHCAARLSAEVAPLRKHDTWSIGIRDARMASGISDHAGWAIDCWADGIGAHTWPPKMSAEQARKMLAIVSSYKTAGGRRIFGWGAHDSLGGDYHKQASNDPMHVYVRSGITEADVADAAKRLGIGPDGKPTAPPAGAATGVHTVLVGGRTPMARAEVIRQSGMSVARFDRLNPRTPDPVKPGTPVRVPTSVTTIVAGRDRA